MNDAYDKIIGVIATPTRLSIRVAQGKRRRRTSLIELGLRNDAFTEFCG